MPLLDKHNLFSFNQFGFHLNISPLTKTSNCINSNLDKKF